MNSPKEFFSYQIKTCKIMSIACIESITKNDVVFGGLDTSLVFPWDKIYQKKIGK